jgi:hypothetical protein
MSQGLDRAFLPPFFDVQDRIEFVGDCKDVRTTALPAMNPTTTGNHLTKTRNVLKRAISGVGPEIGGSLPRLSRMWSYMGRALFGGLKRV